MSDAFQFGMGGCIGVDVGGTFTDAVLTDGAGDVAGQGADDA